jgi:hypothetical protein
VPDEARAIFRHEALWRMVQGPEKSVLPRFIRPRTFLCLWVLLGLLGLAAVLAWAAQVPVYAAGIAIVTESNGKLNLVVLLPPESFEKLRVGQNVLVHWSPPDEPAGTRLTHVEPGIHSPAEMRDRFGLSCETVNRAAIVALADPQGVVPATQEFPWEAHLGTTVSVDVEIGSRPALSLLTLFDEELRSH